MLYGATCFFYITYYVIQRERADNNILIKENFMTIVLFQEILLFQISVVSLIAAYPQYLDLRVSYFVDKNMLIYGVPN